MRLQNRDSCRHCHFIGLVFFLSSVCFEHGNTQQWSPVTPERTGQLWRQGYGQPTNHSRWGHFVRNWKLNLSNDEVSIVTAPRLLSPLQILMTMRLPSPSKHPQTSCGTENQPFDSSRKFDGFNYPFSLLPFKSKPQSLFKYFMPKITIEIAATDLCAAAKY